jgi:hypothetical protein
MPIPSAPVSGSGAVAPTNLSAVQSVNFSNATVLSVDTVLSMQREPWTLMVHPAALMCRRGRIAPNPAIIAHTPGLGGNGARAEEHGQGAIARMAAEGWRPVPHDIGTAVDVVAFGERRAGSPLSDYIVQHVATAPNGAQVIGYTDAWRRPRQLGFALLWDVDEAGYTSFLEAIGRRLLGELSQQQIRIAVDPILREIAGVASAPPTPDRTRQIEYLTAQLPPEHRAAALPVSAPSAPPALTGSPNPTLIAPPADEPPPRRGR